MNWENPVAVSNKVESESSETRFQAVVIVKLFIADIIQFLLKYTKFINQKLLLVRIL